MLQSQEKIFGLTHSLSPGKSSGFKLTSLRCILRIYEKILLQKEENYYRSSDIRNKKGHE